MNTDREETTFNYDEFITETVFAWLLGINGKEYWLPKNSCEIDREDQTIYVPEWLAIEKNLI